MKEILPHINQKTIEEWIKTYPYCAGIHVLEAVRSQDKPNYLFKKLLQNAAVYTQDRGLLHQLINQSALPSSILKEEQSEIKELPPPILVDNSDEKVQLLVSEIEKIEHSENTSFPEVTVPSIEEKKKKEEIDKKPKEPKEIDSIKEEVQKPLVGKSIDSEEIDRKKNNLEEVITYDPTKALIPIHKPKPPKRPLNFAAGYDPEKELTKLAEKKEQAISNPTFLDWLNQVKKKEEPIKITEQNKTISSNVDKVQSVLDQFLATKRTRPIQKAEFYNAENKAETSAQESLSIVSETLAEIYMRQGLHELAIKVYKKLMLQNPNKKENFATQIKKIEKLIKK